MDPLEKDPRRCALPSPAFLYLTAGLSGAAIMVIEILGTRMLAPFIGMSHFVWTAQITVTLIALSCGYYLGGRIADRTQNPQRLYQALLFAAMYLSLSGLLCKRVALWSLRFDLATGALLDSAVLFFVPLTLLAVTGPFLARAFTRQVADVGRTVGRLSALGTLGSITGTVLIGYFLLPRLPNHVILNGTAAGLGLLALAFFVRERRFLVPPLAVVLLALLFAQLPAPRIYRRSTELLSRNSQFGEIQVVAKPKQAWRYLLNDNLVQNSYDPASHRSLATFTYLLSGLARASHTNIHDVLCIGLGVGVVPMDFAASGARVTVVEINPAMVPVARQFFEFDPSRVTVVVDDARHFLNRCTNSFDVVVLDAFLGDSVPAHLMSREAFQEIHRVLRPEGVLTLNCFATINQGSDFLGKSLYSTLRSVFPEVRLFANREPAIFYCATKRVGRFLQEPDVSTVHPRALGAVQAAYAGEIPTASLKGLVLTDEFNPVEFYDAKSRERFRRRIVADIQRNL